MAWTRTQPETVHYMRGGGPDENWIWFTEEGKIAMTQCPHSEAYMSETHGYRSVEMFNMAVICCDLCQQMALQTILTQVMENMTEEDSRLDVLRSLRDEARQALLADEAWYERLKTARWHPEYVPTEWDE